MSWTKEMSRVPNCTAIAVLVAVFSLAMAALASEPPSSASKEIASLDKRLNDLIPPLLDEYKVPGAAVAIVDGDWTVVRGFGLRRAKGPEVIGPDTIFEAASLGKPAFAYVVLTWASEGKVDLDLPLSGSLEAAYVGGDRIERVTARHVLSHTTGLPNWRPDRFSAQPKPLEFLRDPGVEFGYSGEGYMYLQAVAETRTGRPLDTIMRDSLFQSIGMTKSSFLWSDSFETDFANPHGYWGEEKQKRRSRKAGAAFSLHTTASDYSRFLRVMLKADNEAAQAMLEPQINLSGSNQLAWGLGWGIERRRDGNWFWHWGDNVGYKHFVMGSRSEGRAVLVLTNARRGAHVYRVVVEEVLGFLPAALDHPFIQY